MRIGESHPLAGKLVEMRRGDFRIRILNTEITVAHIIGVNDDDVRAISGGGTGDQQDSEKESANESEDHGWGRGRVFG